MARDIVIWPHKVLTTPSKPVTDFGPELEKLIQEMADSMREAEGIGIAAPQIGVPLRLALVGREDGTWFEIANPELLEKSEPVSLQEGCLSVPDEFDKVARFRKVRVRYQDKTGQWHDVTAEDRLAHVFQHEIDHLDGTVFVTHLSTLKRGLIREKMQKLQRQLARKSEAKE